MARGMFAEREELACEWQGNTPRKTFTLAGEEDIEDCSDKTIDERDVHLEEWISLEYPEERSEEECFEEEYLPKKNSFPNSLKIA